VRTPNINPNRVVFVDIQRDWKKLKPIFQSGEATDIWLRNFADYADMRHPGGKWNLIKEYPMDYDSCDWRFNRRRGPNPHFWNYACHAACHWVADLGLFVAMEAYPFAGWRIITSGKHSTVWNGDAKYPTLFDINFSAIGVTPKEAWELATTKGNVLEIGEFLRPHVFYPPFTRWFKKQTRKPESVYIYSKKG